MPRLQDRRNDSHKIDFNKEAPSIVLNIVIFTIYRDKLCIILLDKDIKGKSSYILPEGFVRRGYSLEENFDEILLHRTGIDGVYKEQLHTFGENDTIGFRSNHISISYFALVNKNIFLKDVDLTKIHIIEFNNIENFNIGFDHLEIIKFARERLRFRLEYTTISKDILPSRFTLSQMQKTYEIIFGEELDKRNFRRKVEELNIVKFTGKFDKISSNRPAKLYEFNDKNLKYLNEDLINFVI